MKSRIVALLLMTLLAGCDEAVIAPPGRSTSPVPPLATPTPAPLVAEAEKPLIAAPKVLPILSVAGYNLIIEFEVGGRSGYDPHPEAPDWSFSGITWGLGYDAHQTKAAVILDDWVALGPDARRLAAMQPYYGRTAKEHLHEVHDILISWANANDVFLRLDVGREFRSCRKVYPGFDELRPNAQAALISLNFNRGGSMIGDSRREMRAIRDLVSKRDYAGMATQFRKMIRVWIGREIERGMTRRRYAEAKLMETP